MSKPKSESDIHINLTQLLDQAQSYSRALQSWEITWISVEGHILPQIKIVYI